MLDAILEKNKLYYDDIEQECSDDDILEISRDLEKWEIVAYHLRLKRTDIEKIKEEAADADLRRLYTLQKWKSIGVKRDNSATYRVLIKALLKCGLTDLAQTVCKRLT